MEEKNGKYEKLLAGVIAARATSFLFNKLLLADMEPLNLLAVRFLIAFAVLVLLFRREMRAVKRETVQRGLVVGTLFFLTMAFEMAALREADSSLVSLLENCTIIFVPLFGIVIDRTLPSRMTVLCAATAMAGVVLLALQQGSLRGGFALALVAAVFYTLAILFTAKLTKKDDSSLCIGIIQVGTMGVLSLLGSFALETPHLPRTAPEWLMLSVLVIVCTIFGYTLQPVAQKHVSADRAGLFCAICPAIAALMGVVFLKERLGMLGWFGMALILLSILLPYLRGAKATA